MRIGTTVCYGYTAVMLLLLILFLLPTRISVSLAGRAFHASVLGIVLLCLSFAGILAGAIGIVGLKGRSKLIAAILSLLSAAVMAYVCVGCAVS